MQRLLGWRRRRIVERADIEPAVWEATLARYPYTTDLDDDERSRLHELVALFLHQKSIHGAGGMVLDDAVRLAIAVQACMLVLNLGLDLYGGWVEIIVYPDEFVAEYDYVDEAGVSHRVHEPMSGESWMRGPVILSWADAEEAGRGASYNVVIHEFAHKLDMRNGEPNGFPPLHADMSRAAWAEAFGEAYKHFCERVDDWEETPIDEYAAESPAEFFAVMSEAFFECPERVFEAYPAVYLQLTRFYRHDTLERARRSSGARLQASA